MPERAAWHFDAALVVVVLIWGLNIPIIKVPLEAMHPFTVNLFRFCVSVVVLAGLWAAEARRRGVPFTGLARAMPGTVLRLGLFGHVGYQVLFILGVARTSAGSTALIIASSPVWTALIGHAAGIDRMRRVQWAGLLVSSAGVLLVVLLGAGEVDLTNEAFVGNVLLLVGSVLWALYTVFSRPVLARGAAPLGLAFYSVLAAFPVLAALGVSTVGTTAWAEVDGWTWAALVFSGGLSTGLAYYLWNIAVRHVGPSQTAAFSNLTPFVAILSAYVLLREPITLVQVAGGALIIGGLVVMRRGRAA